MIAFPMSASRGRALNGLIRRVRPGLGAALALALGLGAALLAAAPQSALAQARVTPFGGFNHDSTQPIEVASDTLEVRNAERKAVFSGNVRVRQGDVLMKAEWLEVTYSAGGGQKKEVAGPLGANSGAIDRLRARGEVIISNGAETARSKEADYKVAEAAIFLNGDVILLQGANVIKGERLRIDLTSGTARMVGQGGASSSGRVRVQLDPQRKN